jgi:hydrophobe/amphiphile efflux-1 (HAE1) family protein
MNITDVSVNKPVFAWMLMIATVIFGIVAVTRMGISQFPDVDFPTINVSVTWEGAAPEVMENDVVEVLEEALTQVEGVKSITSSSRLGSASITVELDLSRNIDLSLQDVQTKVSQAQRRLPKDIDPPVIAKTNPEDQPILWLGLSGPYPDRVLSDYVRYRLKERLQTVPGVGEILAGGFAERNVRIWINSSRLSELGLTVNDVAAAVQREHVELPAGRIEADGREINVRVLGEALDLDTFKKLVVRQFDGGVVRLEDVSLVEDGFEDIRRKARVDGNPAMGLGVKKQRGANAVEVAQEVKRVLDEIQKTLPEGMQIGINFDSTKFIEHSVNEIKFELILSVLLTALICWMFLGSLSSTLNVVLAIPMSLFGTIAVIYFAGFTLNTFTLLALALAVGIVVDDAIMVMENIFRHGEEGASRRVAALEGTKEITFAALAATLAVVAIFIPVVFMEGVIGKFFLQFGVTLCVCVLLSYLEAITLAPARMSQLLISSRERSNFIGRWVDNAFHRLELLYERVLGGSLKRPGLVLLVSLAVFALSLVVFMYLPGEFVPSQDQSLIVLRLQTAVGSDLDETDYVFKKAEDILLKRPEVKRVFLTIGGGGGGASLVNTGTVFVTLAPPNERNKTQAEFSSDIRKELNGIPGLRAVVQDLSQSGFTAQRGFPVEFSVRGSNWDEIVRVSQDAMRKLNSTGTVVDLDTDYLLGMPELQIVPDRARCADLGIPVEDVATVLNSLVGGVRVGKFSDGVRRLDIRMRLQADQRNSPEDINRLRVRTKKGELVPLSTLITSVERPALQAITRRDRERAVTVFANVAPGHSQDEALKEVENLSKDMPVGCRIVLGGASIAYRESISSLIFALILGILVAYMVLASQFNSFLHPVTVLTILPLSVTGAAIALLVSGNSLSIFSMIGLLLLMGIVKKNSIILVDYTNQLRQQGMSALDALKRAGPVRLRPILMTAIATLMAAVPPALGIGEGSEIRAPMAVAIIGGLIVATMLSLVVVPAFYLVTDRITSKYKKKH